jgi:hypothetical protein
MSAASTAGFVAADDAAPTVSAGRPSAPRITHTDRPSGAEQIAQHRDTGQPDPGMIGGLVRQRLDDRLQMPRRRARPKLGAIAIECQDAILR